MSALEVIFVAIGLSLDAFAVMVCKGAMLSKMDKSKILLSGIILGGWQLLALLLGNLIAAIPIFNEGPRKVSIIGEALSVMIFLGIGTYMLWKGLRHDVIFERREDGINLKEICVLASIISIDSFFAGIGFAFLETKLLEEAFIVLIITIILSALGLYTGYRLGYEQKTKAYIIGGIILIIAGIDVVIRYLGVT